MLSPSLSREITPTWTKDLNVAKRAISELLTDSRVALILGAGASVSFKLPQWDELLDSVESTLNSERVSFSNITDEKARAQKIKEVLFNNDSGEFIDAVRSALYQGYDPTFEKLSQNSALSSLASIVLAGSKYDRFNIITFNFDDVMELYLRFHGHSAYAVTEHNTWADFGASVNIYHIHGYLPFFDTNSSKNIVLDEDSFNAISDSKWDARIKPILLENFCIFFGLSGDDTHLIDLMEDTEANHILANNNPSHFWGIRLNCGGTANEGEKWAKWGIANIEFDSWLEAYSYLFSISQISSFGQELAIKNHSK